MIWTTSLSRPGPSVTDLLWPTVARLFGGNLPVRLSAWDGSEIGPPSRPAVILRDRRAVLRLLWQPSELGLVRAYVAGELDVDGDLTECLRLLVKAAAEARLAGGRLPARRLAGAARAAARLHALGLPPKPPADELRGPGRPGVRRRGERLGRTGSLSQRSGNNRIGATTIRYAPRESVAADAAETSAVGRLRHDLRPEFWQLILGPQLANTAGLWAPGCQNLAEAQVARLDAICARLRLQPGSLLLDLGCGWGALAIHAAQFHDACVTAVTTSGEQAAFIERRAAERGLASKVTVLTTELSEISLPQQDAVAVELGEQLDGSDFAACRDLVLDLLKPGGRLLIQQMSHGSRSGGGPFIERYVAPSLEMRPVGDTISLLERAGFEISSVSTMRRDLARTIRAWQQQLDDRWDDALAIAGVEATRTWQLCLAGMALAFGAGRMDVHQILAVPRVFSRASTQQAGTLPADPRQASTRASGDQDAGGQIARGQTARSQTARSQTATSQTATSQTATSQDTGIPSAGPRPARDSADGATPDSMSTFDVMATGNISGSNSAGDDGAGDDGAVVDNAVEFTQVGVGPADIAAFEYHAADILITGGRRAVYATGERPAAIRPAGAHAAGIRPVGAAHSLLAELVTRSHRPDPKHASQATARSG